MVEFDVRKHKLVPKHEVLPPERARQVLERYRVTPHQLPLIKASDPAAKAIGAKPGDILKITRDSPTAGKAIIYRYVIEG
jgi:DNA-directed RNA polymerase subunit H